MGRPLGATASASPARTRARLEPRTSGVTLQTTGCGLYGGAIIPTRRCPCHLFLFTFRAGAFGVGSQSRFSQSTNAVRGRKRCGTISGPPRPEPSMSDPDYTHSASPDASGTQSHAPTPSGLTYSLDPHATVTPDPLPVVPAGADIPGYVILEELGRGGMAVVNKARQITLSRTVALKTMLRADPVSRVRFLAEAEAVAAIKHPHVVQVFEVGEHAGTPYLAMEY